MVSRFLGEAKLFIINLNSTNVCSENGAQYIIDKLDEIFVYVPFNFPSHNAQWDVEEA